MSGQLNDSLPFFHFFSGSIFLVILKVLYEESYTKPLPPLEKGLKPLLEWQPLCNKLRAFTIYFYPTSLETNQNLIFVAYITTLHHHRFPWISIWVSSFHPDFAPKAQLASAQPDAPWTVLRQTQSSAAAKGSSAAQRIMSWRRFQWLLFGAKFYEWKMVYICGYRIWIHSWCESPQKIWNSYGFLWDHRVASFSGPGIPTETSLDFSLGHAFWFTPICWVYAGPGGRHCHCWIRYTNHTLVKSWLGWHLHFAAKK